MAWSKGDIVDQAYAELALAGFEWDITPAEKTWALQKLDLMMAGLLGRQVNVGYSFGMSPTDTSLSQDSGLRLMFVEPVYMMLALRICAGKGKTTPISTASNARGAFNSLLAWVARNQVEQQQLPNRLGRGAGNKPWRTVNQPFMPRPNLDPLRVADDGELAFFDIIQGST
jgi:hypothetical protein